jgi:protein phosphatase
MTAIELPADALVVLIGASGAGKTTFATRSFRPTEILSSDAFRAIVADDEADQGATQAAFELLHLAARRRLERGRLTVVDATNVSRRARAALVAVARSAGRPVIAVVLDFSADLCRVRNAARAGRSVGDAVIDRQRAELGRSLAAPRGLAAEGFDGVHRFADPVEFDGATIVRLPSGGRRPGPAGPGTHGGGATHG